VGRVLAKIELITQPFISQELRSWRFGNQSVSIDFDRNDGMRRDCQQIQGLFSRTALHKNNNSLSNLEPWFERGTDFTTVRSLNRPKDSGIVEGSTIGRSLID
jgi:hypothetical protein